MLIHGGLNQLKWNMSYYKLYQSKVIIDNYKEFIAISSVVHNNLKDRLNSQDTTWTYEQYNLFSFTSGSTLFYNLFLELKTFIRDYYNSPNPLWMTAWLNFHNYNESEKSLQSHGHDCSFHGYISVNPQDTETQFYKGLTIENTPGQVYIGPAGHWNIDYYHRVVNKSEFSEPRITIGFNIHDNKDILLNPNCIPI